MKNNKESAKAKKEKDKEKGNQPSPGNPADETSMEKTEPVAAKKEEEVSPGKEGQAPPASSTAESSVEGVGPLKPVRDHFPYMGTDSTAVVNFEILSLEETEEEEKEKVKAWLERSKGPTVDANAEIMTSTRGGGMKNSEPLKAD
jgi:hypothetical protein